MLRPIDISPKYNALVAADRTGQVERVFTAAAQSSATAHALSELLRFDTSEHTQWTTQLGRLNARLTLVLEVARRRDNGQPLAKAIAALEGIDKQALARRCGQNVLSRIPRELTGEAAEIVEVAPETPSSHVAKFRVQLAAFGDLACSDLLPALINRSLPEAKRQEIAKRPARASVTPVPDRLTRESLRVFHDEVSRLRTGSSATFAAAAAHVLADGRQRIEVARGERCCVIVGRDLASDPRRPETWGASVVIVDAWLAAHGHPYAFTKDNYPHKPALNGLSILFDSQDLAPARRFA